MRKVEYPVVLVFHEKDVDRTFVIDDEVELHKAFTKMLLERIDDGYWYQSKEAILNEIASSKKRLRDSNEYHSLTVEEITNLPPALKEKATAAFSTEKKALVRIDREHEHDLLFAELLEAFVKAEAPHEETFANSREYEKNLAEMLCDMRMDYQYEGYEIIVPERL